MVYFVCKARPGIPFDEKLTSKDKKGTSWDEKGTYKLLLPSRPERSFLRVSGKNKSKI